jgi:FkbM family methyltransferase
MTSQIKSLAKRILPQTLWNRLRVARIRYGVEHYNPRIVRHTYRGFPLEVYLADPMAEGWYDHDWPRMPEIEMMERYRLRPGARIFDLGAHQCVVALVLSKVVGPAGQVVAVEANPHNVAVARRNREENGASWMEIVEAAVAEKSGSVTFNLALNGRVDEGRGEWGTRTVNSVSIDDLADRYGVPDVLYIDIEGFEAKALEGAANTLRHHPDCFIEVHAGKGLERYGYSAQSVLSFFPREDYRLFVAGQTESDFHVLEDYACAPRERFFLIAASRQSGGPL